jgi:DNA-binding transcriptional MerR regulator
VSMTKPTPQSQGTFSFIDEVKKKEPLPQPSSNTLRPPKKVEIIEEFVPTEENIPVLDGETIAHETSKDEVPAIENNDEHEAVNVVEIIGDENKETAIANEQEGEETKTSGRGRKSVKENSLAADLVQIPEDEILFQKQYYSMGEVTAMFRENHSLIRYWETEFDILQPKKNGKGDRFFRPVDVKNLYLIYDLLRRRKFTIEGAKEYLKSNKKAREKFEAVQSLQKIKNFFLELKAGL